MKTSELQGAALDWAVASVEKLPMDLLIWKDDFPVVQRTFLGHTDILRCEFSTNWAQGGPIIEREEIKLTPPLSGESEWFAACGNGDVAGPTPLVAAMRCFVALCLGDEIEIPAELS